MNLRTLKEIKTETNRFKKRLNDVIRRFEVDPFAYRGCKETGAVRRAALDLKNELTKITNP